MSVTNKVVLALMVAMVILAPAGTPRVSSPLQSRLRAAERPTGQANWQQWDAFITFVVKRLGQTLGSPLRESLGDLLLDARYEMVRALGSSKADESGVVPDLFLSAMRKLSPLLREGMVGLPRATASQYSNFITAVERLASLGEIGFQLGFVSLSPDSLRGMARILDPSDASDPVAYNTDVDLVLRQALGFRASLPAPEPFSVFERGHYFTPPLPSGKRPPEPGPDVEEDVIKLNRWVPERKEIKSYLIEVRDLLRVLSEKTLATSRLAPEFQALYRDLVFATAWQESCWRQFVRTGDKLVPLTSGTGDVGLMQVNRYVWRGVYDIRGLDNDIMYNGRAGSEILLRYLSRYAIRRGEHRQPGGIDNLPRATYGAYNGGPRHLTRYRAPRPNPSLKRVDDLFWEKYVAVRSDGELAVERCYGF